MLKVRPAGARPRSSSNVGSGPLTRSRSRSRCASRSRLALGPDSHFARLCPGLDRTSGDRSRRKRMPGRYSAMKKSRAGKRWPHKTKNSYKPPTYVLTIMGKIIYRRLRRNSLISRGVDLVKQISSCSLLGWGGGLLKCVRSRSTNETTESNCHVPSDNKRNAHLSPSVSKSKVSQEDSPASAGSSENCDLDSNVNAKFAPSSGQDSKETAPSQQTGVGKIKAGHLKKARHRVRKVVRHRGLVARSMGGSKLMKRCRVKNKQKGKPFCPISKRNKRKTKRKLSLKQTTCPLSHLIEKDVGNTDNTDECCLPGLLPNTGKNYKGFSDKDVCPRTPGCSTFKNSEAPLTQERVKTKTSPEAVKPAQRKAQKWSAPLLSLVEKMGTGGRISAHIDKKKRVDRKVYEQKEKPDSAKLPDDSEPNVSNGHDNAKVLSSDTSEWPYLPVRGRTKGHTKETATEIVKSKHSASVTKMTKKRWADIVCRGIKEPPAAKKSGQVKEIGTPLGESGVKSKTWASVAAADVLQSEKLVRNHPESQGEQRGETVSAVAASGSGSLKKKKKKVEYGLTYTDRIWLTCQKPKGTSHVQSFYLRHFGDGKTKLSHRKRNAASPLRKSREKRRERPQPEKQTNVAVNTDSSLPGSSRESDSKSPPPTRPQRRGETRLKCTSSNRDCYGENACLVDNMPVIYTKKAGMVITLNESSHDPPTHINVNKCNNRVHCAPPGRLPSKRRPVASGNSLELSSVSSTELCSQLSSITFHSPTDSGLPDTKESRVSSKTRKPASAQSSFGPSRRSHLSNQEVSQLDGAAGRPKKISLGYRALLRDSSGPLNARAVSEIHTRHKRADTLQDDKVATRAMRRRLRAERQKTSHNLRRTQARSITPGRGQTSQPGPSTRREAAEHEQLRQTRCRGSKERKRPTTSALSITATKTEDDHLKSVSSPLSAAQAESTSSCNSAEAEVMWRPADTNTANNARSPEDGTRRAAAARTNLMAFRNHPCTSETELFATPFFIISFLFYAFWLETKALLSSYIPIANIFLLFNLYLRIK